MGITRKLSQGRRIQAQKSPGADAAVYDTYWVQHEEVHTLSRGEGHQRGTAIECIASGHNIAAGLQCILFRRLVFCGLRQMDRKTWSLMVVIGENPLPEAWPPDLWSGEP
jgi:hypothetical protein